MDKQDIAAIKAANPLADVAGRWLELKRSGSKLVSVCPFHPDNTPSLTIYPDNHFHCYGCDAHGDVIDFVRKIMDCEFSEAVEKISGKRLPKPNGVRAKLPPMPKNESDEWDVMPFVPDFADPFDPSRVWNPNCSEWKSYDPENVYVYETPEGIAGYVMRMNWNGNKVFTPVTYATNVKTGEMSWVTKAMAGERPLYGLMDLKARPDAKVILVEGEKAKEAAARLFPKYVTVTWSGGSNAYGKTSIMPLVGRDILLWPDADAAGVKAMHAIANALHMEDSSKVKIVDVQSLEKGYDAADAEIDKETKNLDVVKLLKDRIIDYTPDLPIPPSQDEDSDDVEPASIPNFRFTSVASLIANPRKPDWLVKNILEVDTISMIFSDPGVGKSFVSVDLACSVATGRDWNGHRVQKGPVAYICGEGHNGMARRFRAWEIARQTDLKNAPIVISHGQASLTDQDSLAAVLRAIKILEAELSEPPKLVVVDTVARTFGPGNENSTQDMGIYVQAIDAIRHATGAAVLLCHHTLRDRNEKHRARGSMALTAALDFEYAITQQGPKEDGVIVVANKKCKDHEPPKDIALKFATVDLDMTDDEGDSVTSAVLNLTVIEKNPEGDYTNEKGERVTDSSTLLNLLRDYGMQNGSTISLHRDELATHFKDHTGKKQAAFRASLKRLKEAKKVHEIGEFIQLSLAAFT